MDVPGFQAFMSPLLELCGDGQEWSFKDAREELADRFSLTEEQRATLLPSGRQPVYVNRIGWAKTFLKKAGLIAYPRRGYVEITDLGRELLAEGAENINTAFLERYEDFREFRQRDTDSSDVRTDLNSPETTHDTPEESLEYSYQRLRDDLAQELLEKVRSVSWQFFEQLVLDLLVAMGYGGSRKEAGKRVGRSGDEGIDGIINEDRLGLDVVYIQAKKWQNTIGRPEIQKFVGALQGQRARKGVFITTSSFTQEATSYAAYLESKVILIDGAQLAQYMIDYNVGVSSVSTYVVKQIDSDFFEEG